MDITSLLNVSSPVIANKAAQASTRTGETDDQSFDTLFKSALSNIGETNSLLNKQEEEEIKFALGISENTHDLSIAAAKASTALSYTVALRDKFIEAYKEIMQIQI
ncbi:MAG: flagellar hook-basal body complex protein FliE [Lachnospiraceae bacterium]|nr:flagellar hook-basal body complex protein FliE [Lachnospiraceae bacterium]MBR5766780.1 flagellar hook-basal body complex protein FliE [Lachnospiraceae bacterium]MBR6486994.1 flagellar hook-basal body complex protein FliE [Lachnospiraceae bacterium]